VTLARDTACGAAPLTATSAVNRERHERGKRHVHRPVSRWAVRQRHGPLDAELHGRVHGRLRVSSGVGERDRQSVSRGQVQRRRLSRMHELQVRRLTRFLPMRDVEGWRRL
jgi:hypothetical protein